MKFLFLLLAFAGPLLSQDFIFDKKLGRSIPNYVGELKIAKGSVYKLVDGDKKEVQVGTRFFKNETLVTDDKSFAKVIIVDDSIVTLGSNTELNFEKFKFQDKTNRQIVYSLIKGQISALVKKKADEGDIIIKTKFTVMGVRGTKVLANFQTLNNLQISEFALLSGKAEVTDEENKKHQISVPERIIFIHDSVKGQQGTEKKELPSELFQRLKAKELDEEKDFKPFLPYFQPETVKQDSPLYSLVHGKADAPLIKKSNSEKSQNKRRKEKKGWRENLRKLNEQLKENQKLDK